MHRSLLEIRVVDDVVNPIVVLADGHRKDVPRRAGAAMSAARYKHCWHRGWSAPLGSCVTTERYHRLSSDVHQEVAGHDTGDVSAHQVRRVLRLPRPQPEARLMPAPAQGSARLGRQQKTNLQTDLISARKCLAA